MIAKEANQTPPHRQIPNWLLHGLGIFGDTLEKIGLKGSISQENAWSSTLFHWFDNSKAKKELGFSPRPAQEAIHNSVQWMKDHSLVK